jgi:hypothetical protein
MAVVTTTTFPESRYSAYQYVPPWLICGIDAHASAVYRSEDFMRRYMWPNSVIPSAVTLINAANSASQGRFLVESVENHAARVYPCTAIRAHAFLLTSAVPRLPSHAARMGPAARAKPDPVGHGERLPDAA